MSAGRVPVLDVCGGRVGERMGMVVVYRIADTLVMLLLVVAGCYMKMQGFNRCGNWIVIVGLVRILLNCTNINIKV